MTELHSFTFPGAILARGFWLYVWRIDTPKGERLYVGRTGDSSSPNATSPYTRMGQHLGFSEKSSPLRRLLTEKGIVPERCTEYELVSYGPIFPEVGMQDGEGCDRQMERHEPVRDKMAALERDLRNKLADAGYSVLNEVRSRAKTDDELLSEILDAFAQRFQKLKGAG